VDGNEQCSSNAKEAPNPKRTKCNSIAKVRKWNGTYFRYGFFLPDDQILNVAAVAARLHSKNARTTESLNFLFLNFCNNCLFVEMSNNDILDFLTSTVIRVFLIFVNGVPRQTGKYIKGSPMIKRLKSTDVYARTPDSGMAGALPLTF